MDESILFTYKDKDYNIIIKSKYINASEFWLLRSIIGSINIIKTMNENHTNVIDDTLIEKMMENSNVKFYVNKENSILAAVNSQLIESSCGKLIEVNAINALKLYGIKKMEESRERMWCNI